MSHTHRRQSTTLDLQHTERDITNTRVRAILNEVGEGGRVLDVGCVQHDSEASNSPNWLHQHLYGRAQNVLGVDILETEVNNLQNQGFNVKVADAETMTFDQEFDVIVAGELIEHLSNPGQFLDRCREHLSPGGKLVLSTPNAWSIGYLKRLASPGEVHCNEEHTGWFDTRTLRQLLERHGFDADVRYVYPENTTPTPAPQLFYRLGSKRLGALSLLAVATRGDDGTQ